jgi:hypothetical protein
VGPISRRRPRERTLLLLLLLLDRVCKCNMLQLLARLLLLLLLMCDQTGSNGLCYGRKIDLILGA